MKHIQILAFCTALAITAALFAGCSGKNNKTDTDTNPQSDSIMNTDIPQKPTETTENLTKETTPPPQTETALETEQSSDTTEEAVTEKETAPVIDLTPPDNPEKNDPPVTQPPETEPETDSVTKPPVIETPKPVINLTDQAKRGGDPVTGKLTSAQSDNLQLIVNYSLVWEENGDSTLTLDVGLSCYELWCSERKEGGTITVNGVTRTFTSPAIENETHKKQYVPFFTQTYNCTGNTTASIDVSWRFNGNYGGVDIDTLTVGGILQWGTPDMEQPVETEAKEMPQTEPVESAADSETEPIPAIPETADETEAPVSPVAPDPAIPEETVINDTPAPAPGTDVDIGTSAVETSAENPGEAQDINEPIPPAEG